MPKNSKSSLTPGYQAPSSPAKNPAGHFLHERIAVRIREDILSQNLAQGTRLKPIRELTEQYSASYLTVYKAVQILKEDGLLVSRGSAGLFIAKSGNVASNPLASSVRSIAVVHPVWMSDEFPHHFGQSAIQRTLNGFLSECDAFNWRTEMVYSGPPDEAASASFVEKITKRGVDGVLWMRPNLGHRMNMMRLKDAGIEVLGFGRKFSELPLTVLSEDHDAGARLVVDWFLKNGKRRVGLLAAPMEGRLADPYVGEVFEAYVRELSRRKISIDESHVFKGYGLPENEKGILLRDYFRRLRPEGLVCLFNPLFETIATLGASHQEILLNETLFADIMADYRPMKGRATKLLRIANLHYPLEAFGRKLAWHFIRLWKQKTDEPQIELMPSLEIP